MITNSMFTFYNLLQFIASVCSFNPITQESILSHFIFDFHGRDSVKNKEIVDFF